MDDMAVFNTTPVDVDPHHNESNDLGQTLPSTKGYFDASSPCQPVGSFPASGIKVLIVGTGLAGLTAALECHRKGHTVKVVEKGGSTNVAGDMYFMGLSGTRWLKHWPDMVAEYDTISMKDAWLTTYTHTGERKIRMNGASTRLSDENNPRGMYPPGYFQMRPLMHEMLMRQVKKCGIPVEFNTKIVEYWEKEKYAVAVTDKGEWKVANVILVADGVGTTAQKLISGEGNDSRRHSGRAMWRGVISAETLRQHPRVHRHFETNPGESSVSTFLGKGTYGMILVRDDVVVWLINHAADEPTTLDQWSRKVSHEEVLANMDKGLESGWATWVKDLIKLSPAGSILDHHLFWRDPKPDWVSPFARVVTIGDAAHASLPASSAGASMAMEDGVTIASCLQISGRRDVPEAMRVFQRLRFMRTACVCRLGFVNAQHLQCPDWNDLKTCQPKMPRWLWIHNAEWYAYRYYTHASMAIKYHGNEASGSNMDDALIPRPNYPWSSAFDNWAMDDIMWSV